MGFGLRPLLFSYYSRRPANGVSEVERDVRMWFFKGGVMSELLEWVEKQALENLRFRIQDAENLTKESNTTLTLLLTGMGAGLAYGIKLLDSNAEPWLLLSVFMFSAYLLVLCALLIFKCIKISAIPAPTNEPSNLYQVEFSLDSLREAELKNVQQRINEAVTRNNLVAAWLNRIRLFAVGSPIIFSVVAFLAAR